MNPKTRIISIYSAGFVLLVALGIYSYQAIGAYKDSNAIVLHTQQVVNNIQKVFSLIQDMETANRGYAISGN